MLPSSSFRSGARSAAAALLLLACTYAAHGADSYDGTELTIGSVLIGGSTYSHVVVTVGHILSGPTGSSADGSMDSYDPGNNQLTIQSVTVGPATYHNVVVSVGNLVSIGSVSGADVYDGNDLSMSFVQVGATVYQNVNINVGGVGSVVRVAGGMPTYVPDTYNSLTDQLAIAAVQVGPSVYTNVIVKPGKVLSVGGIYGSVGESIFYSFSGRGGISGSTDGADPQAGLIQASDGDFYGTTAEGGAGGIAGTVFQITDQGVETVLHSFSGMVNFSGPDGVTPQSTLIYGADGNLYGTTEYGGTNGVGTVFAVTPEGAVSILYSFGGTSGINDVRDGENPGKGLMKGIDGNLYGVTQNGGEYNYGTIFRITTGGAETVLYSFGASTSDGLQPNAVLYEDTGGNLYGTTNAGGAYRSGTVFKFADGAESLLHSFSGGSGIAGITDDGASPVSALIQGTDGNFYGTTGAGGAYQSGTVFRITPAGAETVLYSFFGNYGALYSDDGAGPVAALVLAGDGNFYGTTSQGGAYGEGTVFKITPSGVETVLHSFSGSTGVAGIPDGGFPGAGQLILGMDGNYYGTTTEGGAHPEGAIYRLTNVIPVK
jgi:uncharacterized repeat protein (TIGR03803 family)